MALTTDILGSYRAPRRVMRRHLDAGVREDRALFYLMLGCAVLFVSQWPVLARDAYLDPSVPLQARLGGALLALLFIAPLVLYLLAALTHLPMKLVGGQGSWFGARLALFWALVAAAPLWLLNGLVAGFLEGPIVQIVGFVVLVGFLALWGASLWEAERPEGPAA
ncbi:YIP1 family protein [Anianabacter salinae]|uniref:YIP1 family protein n=1 Tax=Anianabacter salinae TaxID=2851023 RepID=UPI00225E66E9|nr:YIP1 family protein [Anianabacter salinae]MBV0912231.1 YIP1 family protein [Anianabacter salinae]